MVKIFSYVFVAFVFFILGSFMGFKMLNNYFGKDKIIENNSKLFRLYLLTIQWLQNYINGKRIEEFLVDNNYKKIAIYGMSYIGETLIKELKDSDIEIRYVIENNKNYVSDKYKVYTINDDLEEVDAIIVTPITYYEKIEEELSNKVSCSIISFENVIRECK